MVLTLGGKKYHAWLSNTKMINLYPADHKECLIFNFVVFSLLIFQKLIILFRLWFVYKLNNYSSESFQYDNSKKSNYQGM